MKKRNEMHRKILAGIDIAGPWAMSLPHLEAFLSDLNIAAGLIEDAKKPADERHDSGISAPYTMHGDVAHIQICGPILKSVPWILRTLGINATSTIDTRTALAHAMDNPEVSAVVLAIDSPGGTVSGVQELADDIAKFGKPITAQISDLCASAAYWLASQAHRVSANEGATIGGLGVYTVMHDSSRMGESAGIKTHVLASHPLKGAGAPGSVITDDQLADAQRLVDAIANLFQAHVARGRHMSDEQISAVATGQLWLAGEARQLGLIDQIGHLDIAHTAVIQESILPIMGTTQECKMAEETAGTVAAIQSDMTGEGLKAEIEKTKAEVLRLRAEIGASKAREEANLAEGRLALISKYSDRYAPSGREGMEQAIAHMELDAAEKWLKTFPPIAHTSRTSSAGNVSEVGSANKPAEFLIKAAEITGDDPRSLAFASQFKTFSADGFCVREDGTKIRKENWTTEMASWFMKMGYAVALALVFLFGSPNAQAALSKARATTCKGIGNTQAYLMTASSTVYAGGLVMIVSAGTAQAAAAVASNRGVVGVATKTLTSASSGDYWIPVTDRVVCLYAGDTLEQDDVGKVVYADDDQTIDETTATNDPVAGILVQYVGASSGWVYIDAAVNMGRTNSVTEPLVLTDSLTLSQGLVISQSANNVYKLFENSEDLLLTFASDLLTYSSTTGATLAFTPAAAFADTITSAAGAGALTFSNSAASILLNDNDASALDIGASGDTAIIRVGTLNTGGIIAVTGAVTTTGNVTVSGTLDIAALAGTGATGVGVTAANGAGTACNTTCGGSTCLAGLDQTGPAFVACNSAAADTCLCLP